ncbi:MAG: 3D domain-containing protein [Solirubrobacterales bacterium]
MFLVRARQPFSGRAFAAALAAALLTGVSLAVLFAPAPEAAGTRAVTKPAWLPKMQVTEYYPARESWFAGKRIKTPGVSGRKSKIDWLYSAVGMSMEGDGLGTDGNRYHIDNLGSGGWVGRDGKKANWSSSNKNRTPFWRSSGFWRNSKKGVTFQLDDDSWYAGVGKKWVAPKGITFARGPSLPLRYYRSVATDTSFIPRGSLVWVGRYKSKNGDGWFRADDTGGAINGRHIDVYVKPPRMIGDAGSYSNQRLYVVPKSKIASYIRREKKSDSDGLPLPPSSLY